MVRRFFLQFKVSNYLLETISIVILVIAIFLGAILVESNQSRRTFDQYVGVWEEDIAKQIVSGAEQDFMQKISLQVREFNPAFVKSGFGSFKADRDFSNLGLLEEVYLANITQYGVPVGQVFVVVNQLQLALSAALSPLFLVCVFGLYSLLLYLRNQRRKAHVEKERALLYASHQAALSNLARQVAHDIRSPLSALMAAADCAKRSSFEGSEIIQRAAERIRSVADHLLTSSRVKDKQLGLELLNDELRFSHTTDLSLAESRQNYGRLPSSTTELNKIDRSQLEKAVALVLQEFKISHQKITSGLVTRLHSDNFNIYLSLGDLQRVLSNCLQNSAEACDKEVSVVEIFLEEDAQSLILQVKDNGIGIGQEALDRINKSGCSYRKEGGNGLGIRGAQDLLRPIGGDVWISSKEQIGTLVKITLPKVYSSDSIINPNSSSRVLP